MSRPRLYSKTGCRTCRARKKKCDEKRPVCTNCRRLDLKCHASNSSIAFDNTGSSTPSSDDGRSVAHSHHELLRLPVKNLGTGFPPLRSHYEHEIVISSPSIFASILAPMADTRFGDLRYLSTLSAQSLLVRNALMAFACAGALTGNDRGQEIILRHYQMCVVELKERWNKEALYNSDTALIAMFFMAIVEDLKLGDLRVCIQHHGMLGRMLALQLSKQGDTIAQQRRTLYAVIAETVVYKLAVHSPFLPNVVVSDVSGYFDSLLPEHDQSCSPFLGGSYRTYGVMLRIRGLIRRQNGISSDSVSQAEIRQLEYELDRLEGHTGNFYAGSNVSAAVNATFKNAHLFNLAALRLSLLKIADPALTADSLKVRILVKHAISLLEKIDVHRLRNPTIMLPLIMLACAAIEESDLDHIARQSRDLASVMLPVDATRLQTALRALSRYRSSTQDASMAEIDAATDQLDYIVMLHRLVI